MIRWQTLLAAALVMGAVGCATVPLPVTGADVARLDSGDALVAYLGQPDASPRVCDPRATGPHLTHFDGDIRASLVTGLTNGRIDPVLWRRCVETALDGAPREDAAALLGAVGEGYRVVIENRTFEVSPVLQARLAAAQKVFIEGPTRFDGPSVPIAPLLEELRRALDAHRLGPAATRFAVELLAIADLDRGRYGGRTVDLALLDDLSAHGDEVVLRRFIDHLPSKDLRDEARRRVIRLRIAASPFAEVRASAAQVEERVYQQGFNRISLEQQPALRATWDANKAPRRGVLVRQDVWHQSATLLAQGEGPGATVLPEVPLAGSLWVEVTGLSWPITLCGSPKLLDPAPCVGADEVKIANPLVYLEPGGAFHFVDHISARDAVDLARKSRSVQVPISVGGRQLLTLDWWLRFERPQNLLFAATASGRGPDLLVTIDHTDPARFLFAVARGGSQVLAVVEAADLPSFRIVSRGGAGSVGADGASGSDGSPGLDGSSASCPSMDGGDGTRGGNGSDGAPGLDGGDGGNGGDIQVQIDCGSGGCSQDTLDSLRSIIASEGGPGGPGGSGGHGGRGGRGGSGGSGTTCFKSNGDSASSLSGGASGLDGTDGSTGGNGTNGKPGRAGQVRVSVSPRG